MKIKNKINLSFLGIFLVIMIVIVYVISQIASTELKREVQNHLETTAVSRANHLTSYLTDHVEIIKVFSQMDFFEEFLKAEPGSSEYEAQLASMNKRLQTIKNEHAEYDETFIVDKNGKVVASTDSSQIQKDKSEDKYFTEAKSSGEPYIKDIYYSQTLDEVTIAASAPVHDDQSNEFLGVIVSRINKQDLYKILTNNKGFLESSQVYIVNSNLKLISPDIYGGEILEQEVDTKNVQQCFYAAENANRIGERRDLSPRAVSSEAIESFENYKGKKVMGTHAYIPRAGWCLLAEVEEEKALVSINRLLLYLGGVALFGAIAYFIFAVFIARIITRPIEKLHHGTEVIEKGELSYKVGTDKKDEIGQLSRSFDKMVAAIKKSRKDVDKKVREQTRELRKKAERLADQRKAMLNILEDVDDEKKKTEKEKEKIDAILHSIGDAVFVVDKSMKIIMFNKIAEQISGFSSKEVVGQNYKKNLKFVFEKNEEENDEFIMKAMETGEIKEMANHTLLVTKDGSKVPVADSASPLKNRKGEIRGCVIVFRDVSREREIDKAKTEFVSLASHQLRTPLSAINWYVEMLLNGDAGKVNDDQKDFLNEIYKGNQRMVDLVNALLNVSRIELGTLAVEPELVNFNEIAESVIKELKPAMEKREQKVVKKLDKNLPKIQADPKLVRIIFQNLVSNAVKYTPEKGRIEVQTKKEKEHILIRVKDNGYGIPKDQQDKIFSKLFRADNVQEKDAEGTGLGLYIIKSIVKQAKGEIWFESKKDKGTTFFVKFPLSGMEKKTGDKSLNEVK